MSQTSKKENLLMSVSTYVTNKNKRRFGFSEIIRPDGTSNIFDIETGEVVSEDEIEKLYPIPMNLRSRHNIDKTKDFMYK